MMDDKTLQTRLAAFIRAHREKITPPTHAKQRRRTPGLRREELAELVGVSTTWITWLEQARDVSASSATLKKLALALNLNPAERAALFDLAQKNDPDQVQIVPTQINSVVLTLPMQMMIPAYLLDPLWNVCSYNDLAKLLFRDWLDHTNHSKNLFEFVFLSPNAKSLIVDWEIRARRLAAELQADYHRRPFDVELSNLVTRLQTQSADFCDYWDQQTVLHREEGVRKFYDAKGEVKSFLQTTLFVGQGTAYKLVCLMPC